VFGTPPIPAWAGVPFCDLLDVEREPLPVLPDQFHGLIDVFDNALPAPHFEFADDRLDDGKGHLAQRLQFLVVVYAFQQIHLSDCIEPELFEDIDQQSNLDP